MGMLLRRLCVLIALLLPLGVFADDFPPLRISVGVEERGTSCGGEAVAGSRVFIRVRNHADRSLNPVSPDWPDGYVLEAALDLPSGSPFVATPGAIERLCPVRYLSQLTRLADRRLREGQTSSVDLYDLNSKDFAATLPEEWAGHTLTMRARYHGSSPEMVSEPATLGGIVAPCDRWDSARVWASRLYESWQTGDHAQGIVIADSMLLLGLSDAFGWHYAKLLAISTDRPNRYLAYLERLYADFGVLRVNPDHVPRPDPNGPRSAEQQAAYERARNSLLQKITAQEQQHH